ncbi:MAG TPA: HAMP domain-containing sensor histidine kinase [Bacteroidales bacterium]|nr:HAMP domain-containing sensor histidine kinase [Bacteroidales bacterium]
MFSIADLIAAGSVLALYVFLKSRAEVYLLVELIVVSLLIITGIILSVNFFRHQIMLRDEMESNFRNLEDSFDVRVKDRTKQLEAIRDSVSEYAVQKFELAQELGLVNKEIIRQKDDIIKNNEKLRQAYDEIKRLDDFKNKMTRMIIHDLKNPLNVLLNIVDTWDVPVKQASTIKQISFDMLDLVMNILDVNKFEESKMKVGTDIFSLDKMLAKIIDRLSVLLIKSSLNLKTDIPNNCILKADEHLVGRVIENLISNSMKYTPAGGTIQISASPDKDNIKIEVKDNGKGIQEEMLKYVFDEYAHASDPTRFYGSSTGIGLTYCKFAVDAMGGKIGLESAPGEGTLVWFILPGTIEGSLTKKLKKDISVREIKPGLPGLTKEELNTVRPLLQKIKSTDIYEVSTIMGILAHESFDSSPGLQEWRDAIEKAAFEADKDFFAKLLA